MAGTLSQMAANRPLTLDLKTGTTPLLDTGYLLRSFRTMPSPKADKLETLWGIPHGMRMHSSSATSRFRRLSDAAAWVHGGENLARPRPRYKKKLSDKARMLFWLLHKETSIRAGRKPLCKPPGPQFPKGRGGSKAPRARLAQLIAAARGRVIPPPPRVIVTRSRPFILVTYRARRQAMAKILHSAAKGAMQAAMKD
jgi:hypothetical protein